MERSVGSSLLHGSRTAPEERSRRLVSLMGLLMTAVMAAAARSDAAIYAVVSYLAVLAYYWQQRSEFHRRLSAVAIPVPAIAIIGFSYRAPALISGMSARWLQTWQDFPEADFVAMLASFPEFFAGHTGFFTASEVPWDSYVAWAWAGKAFPPPHSPTCRYCWLSEVSFPGEFNRSCA